MAKKPKPPSPITGRWRIVSMSAWEDDYLDEEVQAFIEFEEKGSGSFQPRQSHCGETKHGPGRFDVVTKGGHDERQVGSAGVRSDSAGDHRSNPSRQAAIPRKQHARQPVVSAPAARGRIPRPRQVRAGPPAQEEAPKGVDRHKKGSQETHNSLESHRTAMGRIDEGT